METEPEKSSLPTIDTSAMKYVSAFIYTFHFFTNNFAAFRRKLSAYYCLQQPEDSEWDEFGNELYAIPDVLPAQSSNVIPEVPPTTNKADEDSKIKALIDTPALDWQRWVSFFLWQLQKNTYTFA